MRPAVYNMQKKLLVWISIVTLHPAALIAAAKPRSGAHAADYAARAREIAAELTARKFKSVFAQFDAALAARMPEKTLREAWTQFFATQGGTAKISYSPVAEHSEESTVTVTYLFVPAASTPNVFNIVLTFDTTGLLADLRFAPRSEEESRLIFGLIWTAPPYANPSKFHEVSVTISDGQWHLPGILTLPNGKGPFPAVVLLSGAGPQDADETTGFNKPLKDIAWGLATDGIAALRYPKRTYVYGAKSSANPQDFTVKDEYIDDARAAVALLAEHKGIDSKEIFIAGYGEGGYIAPRIAAGDSQIAGIIILNGNMRPIEQVVASVFERALKRQSHRTCVQTYPSYDSRGIENTAPAAQSVYPCPPKDLADLQKMIHDTQEQVKAIESPNLKPGRNVEFLGMTFPSYYFLDLRGYNPGRTAANLKVPIFVAQGRDDPLVTKTDFNTWKKALAGHRNITFKWYRSLDASSSSGIPYTVGLAPLVFTEPILPAHVSAKVIHDLTSWIHSH